MKIFIDMDGVLAEWNPAGAVGEPPLWQKPGSHYFLTPKPDERIKDTLVKLIEFYPEDTYVISQIHNQGSIAMPTIKDKKEWLQTHIPEFDLRKFIPVISHDDEKSKSRVVRQKFKDDNNIMVLIDDRNENLVAWTEVGINMVGVKYLNGINKPESYIGPQIDKNMTTEDIISFIRLLAGQDK